MESYPIHSEPPPFPPAHAGPTQSGIDQQLLTAYLSGRDVHCPKCRYNLRELAVNKCPECGTAIALKVGEKSVRLGAYLTLFAVLVYSAISCLLELPWWISVLTEDISARMLVSDTLNGVVYLVGLVVHHLMAIGFIFAIVYRHKLLALPIRTQWWLVVLPGGYMLLEIAWTNYMNFFYFEF